MKKTSIIFIFVLLTSAAFAQPNLKIGHINSQELLQLMPESDSAQLKLEKAAKDLQDQLEAMQVEFNDKYQTYVKQRDTYSELIRQTKEADLQQMNQRIQQFQANAEQEIQKQRADIFKPVLDKANAAIAEVGKENGFTYIIDLSTGAFIYHSENSIDILPLVKLKLKLKAK